MLGTSKKIGALAFVAAAFAAIAQRNEVTNAKLLANRQNDETGGPGTSTNKGHRPGHSNRSAQRAALKRRNVIRFRKAAR